jgi:DNA-binding CsgD family transcriptional regulator
MDLENIDPLEQTLRLVPALAKLCEPLFAASPIAMYGYGEFHRDGRVFSIFSDINFGKHFIDNSIRKDGERVWELKFENFTLNHHRAGFTLFDLEPYAPTSAIGTMASLGLGHVCAFVEMTNEGVLRVHHFVGRLEDQNANDFHLNNTNLLRYFSRFAAKKMQPHLPTARPYIVSEEQIASYRKWMDTLHETSRISVPKFLAEFAPHVALSSRQKELIYWSLMGKTTEETAIILGLKTSTVKKYFDRLKIKFRCSSKNQIIANLLKNGVCFPDLQDSEQF